MMNAWKKPIWVASKTVTINQNGYEIAVIGEPVKYMVNHQPLSSQLDIMEYGATVSSMQKAVVDRNEFDGIFKAGDLAYLDGATPDNEANNGDNANYTIEPPRIQNKAIVVYFRQREANE